MLRVGLIGANPERGWARSSHIPAIRALPELTLSAVATRSMASARAAAAAFGATRAFDDAGALARDDAVDLVVVAVKVPDHRAAVMAALEAGKPVLCEWPLGRDVADAEAMAEVAERAGVATCVGLQGRVAPAAARAAALIADGAIGQPLTAAVYAPNASYGPRALAAHAYLLDPANGANLTTIPAGHALDLAEALLGPIVEVGALGTILFPEVTLGDPPGRARRRTPDHLFIQARHASGCALGMEVAGNQPPGTAFRCTVVGSAGTLTLTGAHPHGFQSSDLKLSASVALDPPPPSAAADLDGPARNVAELYRRFAVAIHGTRETLPDFAHAARLTRVTRAVAISAESGTRQRIA